MHQTRFGSVSIFCPPALVRPETLNIRRRPHLRRSWLGYEVLAEHRTGCFPDRVERPVVWGRSPSGF